MTARRALIALALTGALLTASVAGAQTAPETVVDLTFATSPVERSASLTSTAVAGVSRAGDEVLLSLLPERSRARGAGGVAVRLVKLALLDVPVVHFADGLNHEFGHMARATAAGIPLQLRLVGGPWSAPQFDLRATGKPLLDLGTIGGGFDAELLLEQRLWDRAYEENVTSVSDALTVLDGAIGRFYYVQQDLSALDGRLVDDLVYRAGDPRRYTYDIVAQRPGYADSSDVLAAARSIRTRAWLNFADAGLWAQAWNVARYLWRGDAAFRPFWLRIHGVGLVPFSQYHLSPAGPQIEIGTHYRAGESTGDVCVRWTEPVRGSRLVGSGFSWASASGAIVHPRVRIDVWRGPVAGATGARLEAGGTAARWPSPHARLQVAAGAKTEGYVLGLPEKAGVYVQAGLRLRF